MPLPQDGISRLEERFREQLRVEKLEEDFENLKRENMKLKKVIKKLERKCKKK
tara:strand:+ start:41630 stop:41788 length:159 start_codon:yes stop_codon:yes gene_type:complete